MRLWNQIFSKRGPIRPRCCGMERLEERQLMSVTTYASMAATPMAISAMRENSVVHFKPQAASSGPLDGTYSGTYNGTVTVNDGKGDVTSKISGDVDVTISGDGTNCKFNIPINKNIPLKPSVKTKFKTITISGKKKTTQSTAIVGGPTDDTSGTITITGNKLTFSGDVDMGLMQATVNVTATKK